MIRVGEIVPLIRHCAYVRNKAFPCETGLAEQTNSFLLSSSDGFPMMSV